MTISDYSEDALVEKPAITLMETIGWKCYDAFREFELVKGYIHNNKCDSVELYDA
jgi:hypothetical protein